MILVGHMLIVYDVSTVIYSYVLFEIHSCKIRLTPQYDVFCLLDSQKDILPATVIFWVRLKKRRSQAPFPYDIPIVKKIFYLLQSLFV